jgi:K+-transporting ATPase ATPase B chain
MKPLQIDFNFPDSKNLVFVPTTGSENELSEAAYFASIGDSSPEARAIFHSALALRPKIVLPRSSRYFPPTRARSLSGIDFKDRMIRKGSLDEIEAWVSQVGGTLHNQTRKVVSQIERRGGRALVIADQKRDLGVIEFPQ